MARSFKSKMELFWPRALTDKTKPVSNNMNIKVKPSQKMLKKNFEVIGMIVFHSLGPGNFTKENMWKPPRGAQGL